VWDRLSTSTPSNGQLGEPDQGQQQQKQPRFLQLLALTAFHTFIKESIQAAIFETHHGGEYDATNVVQKPVVTGITTIGMDHVAQLGPSIENVAWHKAGIYKPGTPAFSSPQAPPVETVLRDRAAQKGVSVEFVSDKASLPSNIQPPQVPVQRTNCFLALAMVDAFLKQKASPEHRSLNESDISRGIQGFSWPGRFEIIPEGPHQWFLDGAHNELSVRQAAEWFAKATQKYVESNLSSSTSGSNSSVSRSSPAFPRILIFSHFSEERDGAALLECLAKSLIDYGSAPECVIFTTYREKVDGSTRIGKSRYSRLVPQPYPQLTGSRQIRQDWRNPVPSSQ